MSPADPRTPDPGPLTPAAPRARFVSLGFDYLVITAWLGVLTVVGLGLRPRLPSQAPGTDPTGPDVLAFALTVLPVWVYLVVTEAGRRAATIGKRAAGLRVVRLAGGRASGGRVAWRNAVKLAPWQIAHLAVSRFILDVEIPFAVGAYVVSIVLVVITGALAVRDPLRRGLHDILAGTRVVAVGPD